MNYLDSIGERIRILRKQRGLSQEILAETIGISVKHLSKIERDEVSFSIQILLNLSAYFEVSNDYILIGREIKFSRANLIYFISKMDLD